jgi:hypothetical protein
MGWLMYDAKRVAAYLRELFARLAFWRKQEATAACSNCGRVIRAEESPEGGHAQGVCPLVGSIS